MKIKIKGFKKVYNQADSEDMEKLSEFAEDRNVLKGGLEARKGCILGKMYINEGDDLIRCRKGEFQYYDTSKKVWSELEEFNIDEFYVEVTTV